MLLFWRAPGKRHFSISIRADRNVHLGLFPRLQGVVGRVKSIAACHSTLRLKCIAWVSVGPRYRLTVRVGG